MGANTVDTTTMSESMSNVDPSASPGGLKNRGGPSFDEGPIAKVEENNHKEKKKMEAGFPEDDNDSVGSDQAIMLPSNNPSVHGRKLNPTNEENKPSTEKSTAAKNAQKILPAFSESSDRTKVTHNGILHSGSDKPAEKTTASSSNDDKNKEKNGEETSEGLFLSFDQLYTRRRQRLDAWKKMMNPSSQSSTDHSEDVSKNCNILQLRKGTANLQIKTGQEQTNPISHIASILFPGKSRNNSTEEKEQEKIPNNKSTAMNDIDGDIPAIRSTGKSKASVILQPVLDAPGANKQNLVSPSKVSTAAVKSPSKMSLLTHASFSPRPQEEETIKLSLSIKPTATSEFHDAMSSASGLSESPRHTIRSNPSLRLQPTFTCEWHDTIQSPTSCSTAAGAAFAVKSPTKKTPLFILQQNSSVLSDEEESGSSKSGGELQLKLAANSRSSDHDEFFEAQMLVD
jgi:hypothetical protein